MPLHGELPSRPTYEILRSLHGGTVGELKLCDHLIFGRKCVQKTVSVLGLEDAIAYREPRLLHEIKHDRIVPVYEAQFDPEMSHAVTFVMPYYEGGSILVALEEEYRFSISQAVDITCQVLDGLGFVHHSKRVLHRDPKPANVFLDSHRSSAWLGDFGSAAYMDATGTAEGKTGTPLYTPPEAGPDGGRVGVPGDIYGVGLTLHEMVNGRFPYEELDRPTVLARLDRGMRALPDSQLTFAPHVPETLRRHIRKAIHRSPGNRFQTAGDFIHQLRNHVSSIDWRHTSGLDLDGTWEGMWPPGGRPDQRREYRVESERLLRGGRRRLRAYQRAASEKGWRRFGVEDRLVSLDDWRAVDDFFEVVQARAAHLAPAP